MQVNRIFKFKDGLGKIFFFKRHSNYFIVFLDSYKQHIITLTSGNCWLGRTKKQKISPLNINIIIQKLKEYMDLYNVKGAIFYVKQKLIYLWKKLFKLFKFYDIFIAGYKFILSKRHGDVRGRTPRRV